MSVVKIDGPLKRDTQPEQRVETAPPTAAPRTATTARSQARRRVLRFVIIALLLVVGAGVLSPWLMSRWSHVYVVDSRIAANLITLSSEVAGRVVTVPVVAGDRVAKGDLLVAIEDRQAQLVLQGIDAEVTRIEAEQSELRAQQDMTRKQIASRLVAAEAELAAGEADHRASEAELEQARAEYERVSSLFKSGVVASQRFEEAQARFTSAQQRELHSAAEIERARASHAVIKAEEAQIAVLDRKIATLDAEKTAQRARHDHQLIDLEQRELRAPFDGVIDQTFVDVGEYVAAGTRLLMYHDPGTIWIDANVKETEFDRVKSGAAVTITVDAYPDREFHGQVTRLGQAATSQFALLPSPNPSGNFTKVTQRLPVRIAIEQEDGLLRPGMMVEVAIDVVD